MDNDLGFAVYTLLKAKQGVHYLFIDYSFNVALSIVITDKSKKQHTYNLNNINGFNSFKSYLNVCWGFIFKVTDNKSKVYSIIKDCLDNRLVGNESAKQYIDDVNSLLSN